MWFNKVYYSGGPLRAEDREVSSLKQKQNPAQHRAEVVNKARSVRAVLLLGGRATE
jgi:hypothetical protein